MSLFDDVVLSSSVSGCFVTVFLIYISQKSTFSIPDGNVEIPIYDDYMEVNNPSGTANGRAGPVFSDPIRAPGVEGASDDFAGGGPVLPDFSAEV